MFEPRVKIERGLYEDLKKVAKARDYSSVGEFIAHVLEKAAADGEEDVGEQEVKRRLQGLGYLK